MPSVIFDLDGTLADTSGDLLAAANWCFRDMGLGDVLTAADVGIALRGGRTMLRAGLTRAGRLDEQVVAEYYPKLLAAYDADIDRHTFMYEGAMDAVAEIKARGLAVGICTNKPERLAQKLLTRLGVRDDFACLVGADTLTVSKPDPAPLFEAAERAGGDRQCILIGDSDTDRNTAAAAQVPCVLVTFGPAGGDMAALKPAALLHNYADLPQIAADLLQ